MNRKQYLSLVLVVAVAGFVGGMVSSRAFSPVRAWPEEANVDPQPIQADDIATPRRITLTPSEESEELALENKIETAETTAEAKKAAQDNRVLFARHVYIVDENGKVCGYLGAVRKEPRLWLEESLTDSSYETTLTPARLNLDSKNAFETQHAQLFVMSGTAELEMSSKKGGYVWLGTADSSSQMSGKIGGKSYLSFAGTWDDKDMRGGIILGIDSEGEPRLELSDKDRNIRTTLGATTLKASKTDAINKRGACSLVFFDEKGNVIRELP